MCEKHSTRLKSVLIKIRQLAGIPMQDGGLLHVVEQQWHCSCDWEGHQPNNSVLLRVIVLLSIQISTKVC